MRAMGSLRDNVSTEPLEPKEVSPPEPALEPAKVDSAALCPAASFSGING
jgi:hypothetical protein